ncbi:amylo-alpha-1,6-glucosidase [Actinospica robiniae]|uniref:amylo-alpha-1,6-glucosidase n=1 Tax=Actinospica robiniae TaxID=304901 RepID=UPI0003FBE2B9|nr:glycogen debranching protein [Actinospica robiniae]
MTFTPPGPSFDVHEIPFSHFGSWLALSPVIGNARSSEHVHLVSHQQGMHAVLRFQPLTASDGVAVVQLEATPSQLSWVGTGSRIDAAYERTDTVRLRGNGLGLRITATALELTPFTGTYLYRDPVDGAFVFTSYETGRRYRLTVLRGEASIVGGQALGAAARSVTITASDGASPGWEVAIEEYEAARPPYRTDDSFEAIRQRAAQSFADFLERVAPWRGPSTPAAELAAYVLWSAAVSPAGFVTRPSILMSKHWMDKVWSWDHCFNALALAEGAPELAWHQFQLPFDHQDPFGALPDSVTHSEVLYNYVKPPVHGWAAARLCARTGPADAPEAKSLYTMLARWTEYWLGRRAPGSPLPHYHHGNDSGWDNATTFDQARLVESADLSALLVLQMRQLAKLAGDLGEHQLAEAWQARGDELLRAMIDLLWTGEAFGARMAETGLLQLSDSLLDVIPIVLGEHLPASIHTALAQRVARHLTEHGPATEPVDSPHYRSDGYWRGPIWAPSTVLIEDGLRRAGHVRLADTVSARFRRLCEVSGFAENFDAVSGSGLRDRAYTWTASSYLILAEAAMRPVDTSCRPGTG